MTMWGLQCHTANEAGRGGRIWADAARSTGLDSAS